MPSGGRAGREQAAEIAEPGRTQHRVGDSMQRDVAVRVAVQPRGPVDHDATERRGTPRPERMAVLADADAGRAVTGEGRLDPTEIGRLRHLDVARISGDDMDRDFTGLQQRGLVGPRLGSVGREPLVGGPQQPCRTPCGVCAVPSVSRSTVAPTTSPSTRLTVSAMGRIGIAAPWAAVDSMTARVSSRRDERPRPVMDEDDALRVSRVRPERGGPAATDP